MMTIINPTFVRMKNEKALSVRSTLCGPCLIDSPYSFEFRLNPKIMIAGITNQRSPTRYDAYRGNGLGFGVPYINCISRRALRA